MEGWISLHRQLLENGWLKNHGRLSLWIYLLLSASHKKHKFQLSVKRNSGWATIEVSLDPGQLIFGRKAAHKATGLSEQNVRTIMKQLEKNGSILIEPTNNFSKVTLINWSHYQKNKNSVSTNSPPLDSESTTYNNGNNGNKAAAENISLHPFTIQLKELLTKRNYQLIEKDFLLRTEKLVNRYGEEAFEKVFNGVLKNIDEGKPIENPIAYGARILKDEYPEIGSGASQLEDGAPINEP